MREVNLDSVPMALDVASPAALVERTPESAKRLATTNFLAESLRTAALSADADGAPADAARLWNRLVAGDLVVFELFYTTERWLALLAEREPARAVPPRSRALLEPMLLGKSQKNTAYDNGLSTSTISMQAHRALAGLGISLTPSKAPALLTLLARAGKGLDVPRTRVCRFMHSSRSFLVLSVLRPELELAPQLPTAEYRVLCGLIEGASYAEIAAKRETSTRTVANQIASIFQRLRVSGRSELLASLLCSGGRHLVAGESVKKLTIPKRPRVR